MFGCKKNNFKTLFGDKVQPSIVYTLLSIITCLFVYYIILNANWIFGDDIEWLKTTAIGKIEPMSYHIGGGGRFFPLGHYDFNILTFMPWGYTPFAHYAWIAFSFIIFVIVASIYYEDIIKDAISGNNNYYWLLLFIIVFLMLRVFPVFIDLIFPERVIIVLITIFMLFYYLFWKTDRIIFGLIAIIIAVYVTYCKEPMFGTFLVISMINLGFNYKRLSKNKKLFCYLLVVNAIAFIILYYFLAFRNTTNFYSQITVSSSNNNLFFKILLSHKIFIFAFILGLIRVFQLIINKDRKYLYFDGLLFAGLAYIIALNLLFLDFSYYYLPAMLFLVPSIVYFSIIYFNNVRFISVFMFLFVLFYIFKPIGYIKENQEARKKTYHRISLLVDHIIIGNRILWYQNKATAAKETNILMDWQKNVIETYMNYIICNNMKVELKTISSPKLIHGADILLYSTYNDDNSKNNVRKTLEENNYLRVDSFNSVLVYSYMGKCNYN